MKGGSAKAFYSSGFILVIVYTGILCIFVFVLFVSAQNCCFFLFGRIIFLCVFFFHHFPVEVEALVCFGERKTRHQTDINPPER